MTAAASSLDRLRDGATRWTDASALRQAMRGVTGTASPAARLAAARLAHGAAERDGRSDEEGRLYALLAAGYVLGTCVIGSAPVDGSADAAVDGAVSRLREIEQIGLADLVEAAGSTAGTVARDSSMPRARLRPTSADAPRGRCRSGSAWPRRTGGAMSERRRSRPDLGGRAT